MEYLDGLCCGCEKWIYNQVNRVHCEDCGHLNKGDNYCEVIQGTMPNPQATSCMRYKR